MRRSIPTPVSAVVADVLAAHFTHTQLDTLFETAGAPDGNFSYSNKVDKCRKRLKVVGEQHPDPLRVLGAILHEYLEVEGAREDFSGSFDTSEPVPSTPWQSGADKIVQTLARYNLKYQDGAVLTADEPGRSAPPAKALEQKLRGGQFDAIDEEFRKATASIEKEPREAVRAACALLESLFKVYMDDNDIERPAKQDLGSLWKVIRKEFNLDGSAVEDDDLRKIVTGLGSIVDGVGALRSHASTAHGQGRKSYKLAPRHAGLAVHSAHTLATFLLETWQLRKMST